MVEKEAIFSARIEFPGGGTTEDEVMRAMDRLFKQQPRQGINDLVNELSRSLGTSHINSAAIVFSSDFPTAMSQRGYEKRYEEELLDNGETQQNCVGFERREE